MYPTPGLHGDIGIFVFIGRFEIVARFSPHISP